MDMNVLPWGYSKYLFQNPFTLHVTKQGQIVEYWKSRKSSLLVGKNWEWNGKGWKYRWHPPLQKKVNPNQTIGIVLQRLLLSMDLPSSSSYFLSEVIDRLLLACMEFWTHQPLNIWNNNYAFVVMIPSTLEETPETSQEYLMSKECFCWLPTHFSLGLTSWLCKQIIETAAS